MKSHGKASVQTIFPLKDGSALRLTTSKYFTPSGRSIHGQGIQPDVEVPFERSPAPPAKGDKAEEIFEQVESGKAPDPTPAEGAEPPTAKKKHDSQLARAVDLLKGIKVYQAKERATP
jgi:carboxyl-terminal processing protease